MFTMDFKRGELVATARAVLHVYGEQTRLLEAGHTKLYDALEVVYQLHANELKRLCNNWSQWHGNDIGDATQLATVLLLMINEDHALRGK